MHCGQAMVQLSHLPKRIGLFHSLPLRDKRPGGELLDRAIRNFHFPSAPCGYLIVNEHLQWHPLVYVSGALAELEVGPVSRNIIGDRRSGERILVALHAS
jgi:hypothetical protein